MLRNYIKVAVRGLRTNNVFSFINIAGLSLGLSCCMLLLLYTKDELSYDRFHSNGTNIYALVCDRIEKDGLDTKSAIASMVQGPAFKQSIPEIQSFTRVDNRGGVVLKDNMIFNENLCWADDNFFSVFSFPLVSGNALTVLSDFSSVVLTTETALKYFGTTDVVNRTINIQIDGQFQPFTITGVAKKAPENSSIQFSMVVPFRRFEKDHPDNGWMWFSFPTFFVLRPDADLRKLANKMEQVYKLQAKSEIDMNHEAGYDTRFKWDLLRFSGMHLNTAYSGTPGASSPIYTYILTAISIFILAIACINFINLSITQSLRRNKEIGIRKAIGGTRVQLIRQFLTESMFVCTISFSIAVLIAYLALPFFNEISNKRLSLNYLFDVKLVAGLAILYIVTILAAGFYPAIILSGTNAISALSGETRFGSKGLLGKSLVIFQFFLATALIIVTIFMNAQFSFLTTTDLGYNDQNLVELVVDQGVMDKQVMDVCRTSFTNVRGVEEVAYCNIGRFGGKTQANGKEFAATYEHVDEHYLHVIQAAILFGRNFSAAYSSDETSSVLVNETFVRSAGWKDAIGKTVDFMNIPGWGSKKVMVIGVVRDFHFESLREKIKPELFTMDSQLPLGRFLIRINPANIPATMARLETAFHKVVANSPFQYVFRDESLKKGYNKELRWKKIVSASALISIFISCIGLFGLAMLLTKRRGKEIAIRKLLGASSLQLVKIVASDFVKLVMIGLTIAIPVGWWVMNVWLQNFAYRITLSWWVFGISAIVALFVALVTVGFHAIRAAQANPAVTLRNQIKLTR